MKSISYLQEAYITTFIIFSGSIHEDVALIAVGGGGGVLVMQGFSRVQPSSV